MKYVEEELIKWSDLLLGYHLPRWNELPDIELYMEQVVTLIHGYFEILFDDDDDFPAITPAMINNYVKLCLIPPPVKKRYNKRHIGYLIAITMLKQVFTITEIKQGILLQSKAVGLRNAYDLFCDEQEAALKEVASMVKRNRPDELIVGGFDFANVTLKAATMALACKIVTSRTLRLRAGEIEDSAK